MATPAPPFGGPTPPAPDMSAAPPVEEMRECPCCMGSGQIPASMGREEILQAIDAGMPNPAEPEKGEMHNQSPTPSASAFSRTPPMTEEQNAEVSRLGTQARDRMSKRNFGF